MTAPTITALLVSLTMTFVAPAPIASAQGFTTLKEIRERGIVMQKWETSCAAASLATVLTYGFRDPVSEYQVASKMLEKTDPLKVRDEGGFSLLDMKRFVDDRGYVGKAYKNMSFEDLRIFHAPIVPIDAKGYNHYVVFNGVEDNRVLLADPAFGHRSMPIAQFERVWMNGMAFVVTRPEATEKGPTASVVTSGVADSQNAHANQAAESDNPVEPAAVIAVPAQPDAPFASTPSTLASDNAAENNTLRLIVPITPLITTSPPSTGSTFETTISLDRKPFNLPPRRN